jgi:hypothetical protein
MMYLGRNARIWLNEFPYIKYVPIETIKLNISNISNENWERRSVCLEYRPLGDPTRYGLLGIEYFPQQTKCLETNILVSKDKDTSFNSSLLGQYGKTHVGIPMVYANVVSKITTHILQKNPFPAGILVFGIGAHDEIGSSEFIFVQLTRILINIITRDSKTLTKEEIEKIIATKMNERPYSEGN